MVGFWPQALVDSFIIGPIIPTVLVTKVKEVTDVLYKALGS